MITVFTSTYNRAYCLTRLYRSLCVQTYADFEWLIIDDGSIDNTEESINTFLQENKIQIHYHNVPNGGKSRAINKGALLAKGDLFFIVDSDDYLTPGALQNIRFAWEKISNKQEYAGLCFREILASTGQIIGDPFPWQEFDSDILELDYRHTKKADKTVIFQPHVLRQFPFPEIKGENFVPEGVVYNRIAVAGFKLRCVDIGVTLCEYLPDGLTQNFKSNLKKNCIGFSIYYRELLSYRQVPLLIKLKSLIRYLQCKYYQTRSI